MYTPYMSNWTRKPASLQALLRLHETVQRLHHIELLLKIDRAKKQLELAGPPPDTTENR